MVQLIDPVTELRKWCKKIVHVHGKDATIDWDAVVSYTHLGLQNLQYSLATAVGLFKSGISLVLITVGYWLADKFTGYKLF